MTRKKWRLKAHRQWATASGGKNQIKTHNRTTKAMKTEAETTSDDIVSLSSATVFFAVVVVLVYARRIVFANFSLFFFVRLVLHTTHNVTASLFFIFCVCRPSS